MTTTFMASPMSSFNAFLTVRRLPPPSQIGIVSLDFRSYSILPRLSISFARRRNRTDSATTPLPKKKKKEVKDEDQEEVLEPSKPILYHCFVDSGIQFVVLVKDGDEKEDLLKEAFEAFFGDDLENDDSLNEDDISDEELIKLERELKEAFKKYDEEDIIDCTGNEGDNDNNDEEDEFEELLSKLQNWQLHRLAYALKDDSRKTNIKDLADDLCLDQADVLKLLSDPIIMLMTAALPDNLDSTTILDPTQLATTTVSDIETYTPEIYDYEVTHTTLNSEDEEEEVIINVTQTD
ncbi:protein OVEREXPRESSOR OF CATIONIC PEROXIDASE 3-like [Impatiens glandulifera]|uniref:protein OVEREXPRESSOR OF CATIONIC PEROXIDASE 3-like n=1 Tax=Impatiens glandulifera TaxID=253017 RepID=UPI001FB124DB|nr:protein OVEREXPRESSOR OF CATIONIC PEROXIDASE 3-like [Impatiens glandulifera]